jgi:uridine phosphorylase
MSPLRPTAPIAENVILPEDPAMAMAIAQDLLEEPLMSNHAHGLWGYSGRTPEGIRLTVQSSGLGGPSLAMVVEALVGHGVRAVARLGTCRALDPSYRIGERLLVTTATGADGASRALGGTTALKPEAALQAGLRARSGAGITQADVLSRDLDLDSSPGGAADGAGAVDLATAALFALGTARSLRVASLLVVSESASDREGLGDDGLRAAFLDIARIAADALSDAQTER